MEFLGVGPAEIIVILVVALIFVGPERLPKLAADIARTIREIRKYTGNIAAELTGVLEELEQETAEERSQWKEIGQGLTDATKSLGDAVRAARNDAAGISTPAAPPTPNGSAPQQPAASAATTGGDVPGASAYETQGLPPANGTAPVAAEHADEGR